MKGASGDALRLTRERSLLIVVDIQARLAPHVADAAAIIARAEALVAAAAQLAVPAFLTEHCPDQLGPVVSPLRERFAPAHVFAKTRFGAADHPAFDALLHGTGRQQALVAGMEAHVCVMQTTLGLLSRGFEVFVAGDAVGSRPAHAADRTYALERMRAAGAVIVGTETALFEWTRSGDDPAFRAVLGLVKGLDARD